MRGNGWICRGRSRSQQVTAFTQALAVLQSYGSAVNMYSSGIGYVNGIDAGNYLNTTGELASIGGPVGRVVPSPGSIEAQNTTTPQKPILLRDATGRYSWGFSAAWSRYLRLASVPFNPRSNNLLIVAAKMPAVMPSAMCLFSLGYSVSASPFHRLDVTSDGTVLFRQRNNFGGAVIGVTSSASTVTAGSSYVFACRVLSGQMSLDVDLLPIGTSPTAASPLDVDRATIGALGRSGYQEFFEGEQSHVVTINGAVSDADKTLFIKGLASLQGRTI